MYIFGVLLKTQKPKPRWELVYCWRGERLDSGISYTNLK
jgi:hypothetical protein